MPGFRSDSVQLSYLRAAYTHIYAYPQAHSDSHGYTYGYANAEAYAHADTHTYAYTHTGGVLSQLHDSGRLRRAQFSHHRLRKYGARLALALCQYDRQL